MGVMDGDDKDLGSSAAIMDAQKLPGRRLTPTTQNKSIAVIDYK